MPSHDAVAAARRIEVARPDARPMRLIASGIDHDPLPEAEDGGCHVYAPGEKITALTDANIRSAAELGFGTLQIAAGPHFNEDVRPDGAADWRRLDADLATLARHDMGVVLVSGFYWVPPALRGHEQVVPLRCLQHDRTLPILSPWSPFTYAWIDRCTGALAAHLRTSPARLEAITVMLNGDFGEAIFPAGMLNVGTAGRAFVDGVELHTHGGFWCGDPCARSDYVALRAGRAGVGPDPAAPDLFPTPPDDGAPSRSWLDFLDWYHAAMTRYAQRVVGIYRRHFPDPELVIWLGGGVEPHAHGQDNSGLPKAMKSPRGTIRCTAAGSQFVGRRLHRPAEPLAWAFQRNYPLVKRVATACRFYDVPLWLEPPYPPGMAAPEVSARVFEAISCGATAYFEWTRTLQVHRDVYREALEVLRAARPRVDVAVYFPIAAHRARADSVMPQHYWQGAAHLRAAVDYDVVDDRLIRDDALASYAVLVVVQAEWLEPDVRDRIAAWVRAGGTLVVEGGATTRVLDHAERGLRVWGDDGAAPVETTDDVAPLVRMRLGHGAILTSRADDGDGAALAASVRTWLMQAVDDRCDAARLAARWMTGDGRVLATVLEDGVLLANLTPQHVERAVDGREILLAPHGLALVDDASAG